MSRIPSLLLGVTIALGFLFSGGPAVPASAAPTSLAGWSSTVMGPPPSSHVENALPFFVVRGGPGLVAISQPFGGTAPRAWVSADGRHWRFKALDPQSFSGVVRLSAPAPGKRGLVMVGTVKGPPSTEVVPLPHGVVWRSTNGLSWQRIPDPTGVFNGATLSAVTSGGPGYVAVGTVQIQPSPTLASNYRAAVWLSRDAVHWRRAPDAGAGFSAAFINDVAAGGPGLVAVGLAPGPPGHLPVSAIWISRTGSSWRRVALGQGAGVDRIVAGNTDLLALGHTGAGDGLQKTLLWTSRDGLHWRRVATDPFGAGRIPPAITAFGSGFAAAGAYDNAPALWTSADGARWTLAAGSDGFGGLTDVAGLTAWRTGVVVVGRSASPPVVSTAGASISFKAIAWTWTPGTPSTRHSDLAAIDPHSFRLRLADLGPGFIPRSASYGFGCQLIPDLAVLAADTRLRPAVRTQVDTARCERAFSAIQGSLAYSFNFAYGTSNFNGPESEVTGYAILTRSDAQSRAAYKVGGGIVIAGDLNLNTGDPQVVGNVKMAQGGTLYRIGTQGFGTAYAVVWRAGRALGMVEAVGVPGDARARAVTLARAQWRRWKAARG